jgi:serine phosphatase RsbU (regulator of sigma subunit)/Tfp pilus assembly protein PilF
MKQSILLFLSFLFLQASAQDRKRVDSIRQVLRAHTEDTTAVNALNELGMEYEESSDSISFYYYNTAVSLAGKIRFRTGEGDATQNMAIAYFNQGKIDSSLVYYKKALAIFKQANSIRGIAVCYSNLGIAYRQLGNWSEALNCLITALKYAEKIDYTRLSGNCKLSIGNIYRQKNNLVLAEKYYTEALTEFNRIGEPVPKAMAFNNLGLVYSDRKEHKKALEFFFRALAMRDSLKLQRSVANSYDNIACEYNAMDDFNMALSYHRKALDIQEQSGDKKGIATTLINTAAVYTKQEKFAAAIDGLLKAMQLARELKHKDMLKEIYLSLSENYAASAQYKISLDYHRRFSDLKDSLLNENESRQIAQMQTEYETGKKDVEITLLNKSREVQAADLKRKSVIIWTAMAGMLLLLILAFYIYRGYRIKQKANDIISRQKQEVEKQKAIIEEKQKEITDSIQYAKRIQGALLASDAFLKKNLRDHFILYKPKDIVSGDFYWAAKTQEGKFLLATADCTGHGVPGAFMSLLGVNFLNEIITGRQIVQPDKILDQLRKHIIEALNPEGTETEAMDGMDGVLCSFDLEKMELRFAAANNPLWLIRDQELLEYAPDKMPVGKYFEDERQFRLQTLALKKEDIVYTFTDGYADQFGGDKGKKFKYKSLQKLLLSIHHLPLEEQKNQLDQAIERWKGTHEQVDDILIIGVKI